MNNMFINLFSIFANIIAILVIYNCFGKKMEKEKKIKASLIIIGAMYLATIVNYYISGIGVEKVSTSGELRSYLMMAFVPVNLLIIMPYSIYSFIAKNNKKISKKVLNKRLVIVEIIAVCLFIMEFAYFRVSQKNLKITYDKAQNIKNNIEVNDTINNEVVNAEILNNVIEENNNL